MGSPQGQRRRLRNRALKTFPASGASAPRFGIARSALNPRDASTSRRWPRRDRETTAATREQASTALSTQRSGRRCCNQIEERQCRRPRRWLSPRTNSGCRSGARRSGARRESRSLVTRIEPPDTTGLERERALRGGSAATARADGSSTPGVCAASRTARCSLSVFRIGRPAGAGRASGANSPSAAVGAVSGLRRRVAGGLSGPSVAPPWPSRADAREDPRPRAWPRS